MLKTVLIAMILMAISASAFALEVPAISSENGTPPCPFAPHKVPDGPNAANAINATAQNGALTYADVNVQKPAKVDGDGSGVN